MSAPLKALLVAAGTGTRLRPLTGVLPKCLMPINGRPLLGIWLEMLRKAGVDEVIVNLHHHAGLVRDYIARSPYGNAVTLSEEKTLLGTAGTLLHHRDRLSGSPIFFAHADNLAAFDMKRFLKAHDSRPAAALMTMMTFTTATPELCGIVTLDGKGKVVEFHEKPRHPKGNLANAAVYLLEPALFDVLDGLPGPPVDFSTDVLPKVLDRIHTFHNDVYHRDIGTLESLGQAQIDYAGAPSVQAGDPWYGMMAENGGKLEKEFAAAVEAAYPSRSLERGNLVRTRVP